MDNSETSNETISKGTLSENDSYYKYTFKKTEKITGAVFYTLSHIKDKDISEAVISETEKAAQTFLNVSLKALEAREGQCELEVRTLQYACIALESKLRMLHAARGLAPELLFVFVNEIDSVQRSLRNYIHSTAQNPLFGESTFTQNIRSRRTQKRSERYEPKGRVREGQGSLSAQLSNVAPRSTRILEVLREKGHASIKDVSDVIKDCSEKTIQRELNGLIKDGKVVREGERRWSRYSVV